MTSPVDDERLAYLIKAHADKGNWGHSPDTADALTHYAALRRQLAEAGEALLSGANSLLVEQVRYEERARRQNNEADRKLAASIAADAATLRALRTALRGDMRGMK